MQVISHRKHAVNVGTAERVLSAGGGTALAIWGVSRKSPAGIAMAIIGGDLIRRGVTGRSFIYEALGARTAPLGQGAATTSIPYELGIRVDRTVTVDKSRPEVYRFWRDLANLPRFMHHLESVRQTSGNRSHWVANAAGGTVEWDAEIINEAENESVAWRSLPGSDVPNAGSVHFSEAPGQRGTVVHVELQYDPPAGVLGALLAKLWGKEPGQQVQEDLHRLKAILEAGEVPTTAGQPSGDPRQRPSKRSANVDRASEESFPASDAPAWRS